MIAISPASAESGARLRDRAIELLEERRRDLIRIGQRLFLEHVLRHGWATIDHVRRHLIIPPGIDPRLCGAIPLGLMKLGLVAPGAYVHSQRKSAHARAVRKWYMTDAEAIRRWLEYHPASEPGNACSHCGLTHDHPRKRSNTSVQTPYLPGFMEDAA